MDELHDWIGRQVRRERGVVRLEDALLGGRFARYFIYRLRFFAARTVVSTLIHALKIVLILGAFPRSAFVLIIVVQSGAALSGDFWWGALEEMRGQIRELQRRAARHLIPRQISAWLALSVVLAVVGLALALGYVGYRSVTGGFGAAEAFVAAVLVGTSLNLVARTYHSGAYAMRRVYRPLPSLLALDVVGIGALLLLWPFIGLWAFPVAELASVLTVLGISIYFTARTYRTLALPTLSALLRPRIWRRLPTWVQLRACLAPGAAYALVGLEGLVVVAGVFGATTASGETLVGLLAALAPINRASFEWARLLYFDLKRLELPLLASLRRSFDAATLKLGLVIALATWAVAAVVGAWIVAGMTPLLIAGLLALFVARSLLAAVQMQAFTSYAYVRVTAIGAVGVLGVIAAFVQMAGAEPRVLAVAAVLALSFVLLLALPPSRSDGDALMSVPAWLRRVRSMHGPISVTRLSFDARLDVRGTIVERRRAEAWRRATVAERLSVRLARVGGGAAWITPTQLWAAAPLRGATEVASGATAETASAAITLGAGLIDRPPLTAEYADGPAAAAALAGEMLALWRGPTTYAPSAGEGDWVGDVIADFRRRFPSGIACDLARPGSSPLARLTSQARVAIYRAALVFARDLRRGRGADAWEVTALDLDGALRVIFMCDRSAPELVRRAWRNSLRSLTVQAAAGLAVAPRRTAPATAQAPMH